MRYNLIMIIILMVTLFNGCIDQYKHADVFPDKEYKVISIQQIKKDTIFTHYNYIQAGYINDAGRIQFEDFEMDSIIYSNETKIIRVHRGNFGEHNQLYWNGIEVK